MSTNAELIAKARSTGTGHREYDILLEDLADALEVASADTLKARQKQNAQLVIEFMDQPEFKAMLAEVRAKARAVGEAVTVEDLILLPIGAVLRGPDWHEEVYKKTGDVEFYGIASERVWLASNLEPRGPFDVLYMPEAAK